MCYSVEVQKELERIKERFLVEVHLETELRFQKMKERALDPEFVKFALGLSRNPTSPFFKEADKDNRIYPGYFAPVMVMEGGRLVLKNMRYRLRPHQSKEEIPSKFNVFNARSDSLLIRPTWKKVFGSQHGIFPFTRFYEWVEKDGKKQQISFSPQDKELMWAPCLWDYWENLEGNFGFYSFALITDDPPPEVSEKGHDRCPVFLQEYKFKDWLSPQNHTKQELLRMLKHIENVYFLSQWSA